MDVDSAIQKMLGNSKQDKDLFGISKKKKKKGKQLDDEDYEEDDDKSKIW